MNGSNRPPEKNLSHTSLAMATDRELLQALGARLRALRRSQGIAVGEAAAQAGLSRRTVHRAETGQNPTLLTLVRLLRLYGRTAALASLLAEPEISPLSLLDKERRDA